MKNKNSLALSVIAVVMLLVVTIGVSYAFFSYTKKGTTENSIKTGTITFLYTEVTGVGKGIKIEDSLPISDDQGKLLTGSGNVFEFKITSDTLSNTSIPYEVTARKSSNSTLDEKAVKVYLTEVDGEESELLLDNYSNLKETDTNVPEGIVEKTLYKGKVPANTTKYEKNFKLRMWLDEGVDFSPVKDEDGNDTYPYNGKTFTLTVNVYANANVVNEDINEISIFGKQYPVIQKEPTLTTSSNNTSDESGLYKSTATNTGEPTYYFRGAVENNYVSFAGFTWRIVRINEDGTIRMIMQDGINNNTKYFFNTNWKNPPSMYYSNSEVKTTLENWYQTNIGNKSNLVKNIASGNYYCEQAKAKRDLNATAIDANMTVYTDYEPNFKCENDNNGYGLLSSAVGLPTYDEAVYAGGYYGKSNDNYYLNNSSIHLWTMSPSGVSGNVFVWGVITTGSIDSSYVGSAFCLRPVINIKADTTATGAGTSSDPFKIDVFDDTNIDDNNSNTEYTKCADEGSVCTLPSGNYTVRYGANDQYKYLYNQTGSINCNSTTFGGDPINGTVKKCEYKLN